jgi:hypothetical protein
MEKSAMIVSKGRLTILLGVFIYVLLLNVAYIYVVSPQFSYMGYTYESPAFITLIAVSALSLLPALWMPVRLQRPSQVVYWILYILVVIPSCFIPLYRLDIDPVTILMLVFVIFLNFTGLGIIYLLPTALIPSLQLSPRLFWLCIITLSTVLYAIIISTFGFRLRFVPLIDVYDVRAQYTGILAQHGRLVGYAIPLQASAVNPIVIAYGLVRRKPLIVALAVIGQLLIYSITGFKTVFFSGFLMLGLLLCLWRDGRRFGLMLIWGLIALMVASLLAGVILDFQLANSLLIRRVMVTPGLLTGYYFEFFSNSPKAQLGHSVFRTLVSYPYTLEPPRLIGVHYFNPLASANGNVWADAFANFGFWGIFGFTPLLASVLWIIDSLTANRDWRIVCLILGVHGFTLANTALLTSLMTQGIGLTVLLVLLMPPHAARDLYMFRHRERRRLLTSRPQPTRI